MFATMKFAPVKPDDKLTLVVEPAFGALRCKLIEMRGDKENVVIFVTAGYKWLADELALCFKANNKHKGDSVRVSFTWTNTASGFNYYLSRADAERLAAAVKEAM